MKRLRWWWLLAGAALIVALVGFSLSVYVVQPGQAALLLRGNRIVASHIEPGLHWKIPLVEGLAVLDARVRILNAQVNNGASSRSATLATTYAIAWRIDDPKLFFAETAGDPGIVRNRLVAGVNPALKDAMQRSDAATFLKQPADSLETVVRKAAVPVARPLGIGIVNVYLGTAQLPAALVTKIGQQMAAATQTEIGAAKAAGDTRTAQIKEQGAAKREAVLAAANQQAARIRGESEAKVIAMDAQASQQEPAFFDFYQKLEAERTQLISNTKVMVISVDSPWFRALGPGGKSGGRN